MFTAVEPDGAFTGEMALPGTRTRFEVLGFLLVTADVDFEPTGPTTGTLQRTPDRRQELKSTSQYYVRLSNIKVGGIFPLFAGPRCRTKDPVVIQANTPAGETFHYVNGGRLTGEYSIGDFAHCGLNTPLINALVPGDGNTIELTLANGRWNG